MADYTFEIDNLFGAGGPVSHEADIVLNAQTPRDIARRQLDAERAYYSEDPCGTFHACGSRFGCGFAELTVTVDDASGLACVDVDTGLRVSPDKVRPLRKVFRRMNDSFIVPGLEADDDGRVHFRPEPVDLLDDGDLADDVGKAFSTVHGKASAILELEAGRPAWDVMRADKYEDGDDEGDACDDEGGEDTGDDAPAGLADALRRLFS